MSLIRQTQASCERSYFWWLRARKAKAFINNNYREARNENDSGPLAKEKNGQRKSHIRLLLVYMDIIYTYCFTKLSYAPRTRINYSYKTHQSFLRFLFPPTKRPSAAKGLNSKSDVCIFQCRSEIQSRNYKLWKKLRMGCVFRARGKRTFFNAKFICTYLSRRYEKCRRRTNPFMQSRHFYAGLRERKLATMFVKSQW